MSELNEISKKTLHSFLGKSLIKHKLKSFSGEKTAIEKLTGKAKVNATESEQIDELSLKKKWNDNEDHLDSVEKQKKLKLRKTARKFKSNQYEELIHDMLDAIKTESPTAVSEAFDILLRDNLYDILEAAKVEIAEKMFDDEEFEVDADEDINLDDLDEETLDYIINNITEEDYEQLDEISKKTLGDYINKASYDKSAHAETIGYVNGMATGGERLHNYDIRDRDAANKKHGKRSNGIGLAVNKLIRDRG